MSRNNRLEFLHPEFRAIVNVLQEKLRTEELPFRVFEGFRTPQRQQYLYAQGRTRSGDIITKAEPWQSYHQYGFAADFVLFVGGQWSWKDDGAEAAWWKRLHELGRPLGLRRLSKELPHLELASLNIAQLQHGVYPSGGDASWAENLENAITSWGGQPPAPPLPAELPMRPPLDGAEPGAQESVAEPRQRQPYRVIARSGLRLRSGPGVAYDVIGNLAPATVVHLLEINGDWGLVDLNGDGLADGFSSRAFLEPLA